MLNTDKVKVRARTRGRMGYTIPELNIHRVFSKGEYKMIELGELKQLMWTPGGEYLIRNSLVIESKEALKELDLLVEPEYFYSEDDIKVLLERGTLDQLDDALTFGPKGVQELIIKIGVDTKLNDIQKRELILKKTGFNINTAVQIQEMAAEDEAKPEVEESSKRKAAPISATNPEGSGRKAAVPQVTILEK